MTMYGSEFNVRQPSVNVHKFAMIPRAEIPRSSFQMQHTHKTTLDASFLTPIFLQEVLPGDSFHVHMSAFCRMATPVFPVMDNMVMETFFFFVPNRLVWTHWVKFMGEQDNPGDSISFSIPQIVSPAGGYNTGSNADYFGLPVTPMLGANTFSHSALPIRALQLILHQWFRDENLQTAIWTVGTNDGDGPDANTFANGTPFLRGKRHDYFTSCLPWTQKGGVAVTLPLGTSATVKPSASALLTGVQNQATWLATSGAAPTTGVATSFSATGGLGWTGTAISGASGGVYPSNLYADLSTATSASINSIRLAFQTQKLLERDARGGTRYTEIIRSHFGVLSPDARLQRAEYIGGGRSPVNVSPVAQTMATGASGTTTPQGNLAAVGTVVSREHGCRYSSTEHGHIIGLACITADLTYQQGVRRLWNRLTRYDFYFPVFAALGEQAVLNQEIFVAGVPAQDTAAFGYQERWAEYRYMPSMITGSFRSVIATPLDAWHLSQKFATLPALNSTFIGDGLISVLDRNLAAGANARTNFEQFLADFFFSMHCARPMPMYSVPGLIDHF